MKHLFIFILFTLTTFSSDSFSLVIHKPFNNALFDITQDYDRTITAVGFSRAYQNSINNNSTSYSNAFDYLESVSNAYGSQMHLIKVSNSGKVLLSKMARLSKFNEAIAVVKTPTNGYFIGGYTLDGSLLIVKLDSAGNLIFTKTFGTKNYDRMNNLILLSDGGVLAIGSSTTSRSRHDPLFETGLGLNDIYLTRFSKEGRKLWSRKYGTLYDDRGVDAVEARDGSLIVVSTTSYAKNKNVTLMRIGENGNKIWLKHYKSEHLVTPYKLIRLRDNNFILSLSQTNNMNKEQIRLIKFDLQRNVIIDREVPTTYSSAIKDIQEYSDGRLIGVGYIKDNYNTDGLVMVFSNDLSLINQEHYGQENYDMFNAVKILHNSQAVGVGIKTDANSQESNMWIVKFNEHGIISQLTQISDSDSSTTNYYQELREIFAKEIDANQLTIDKELRINLIDKSLYFEVGKYKLDKKQKNFLNDFSRKLINFLFKYKNKIGTLEINGHTSSEWGVNNFTKRYLKNSKLSLSRSYSTLSYIFSIQKKNEIKKFLSQILRGSGYSYSKKREQEGAELKELSRRVSFKIIIR